MLVKKGHGAVCVNALIKRQGNRAGKFSRQALVLIKGTFQ